MVASNGVMASNGVRLAFLHLSDGDRPAIEPARLDAASGGRALDRAVTAA